MKKNLLFLAFFTTLFLSTKAHILNDGFRTFYGNVENNSRIHLKWSAELAVADKGFDIERMNANGLWDKLGTVNNGSTVISETEFDFIDNTPLEGKNTYRLKITQSATSIVYSNAISVDLKRTRLGLNFQNYPNPFLSTTTIKYTVINPGPVKIIIFDITGMQLAILVNKQDEAAGTHEIQFDGGKYPPGTYIYKIFTPEDNITKTMIKAR